MASVFALGGEVPPLSLSEGLLTLLLTAKAREGSPLLGLATGCRRLGSRSGRCGGVDPGRPAEGAGRRPEVLFECFLFRLTPRGRSGLLLDAVEACGSSGCEAGIDEAGFSAGGGESGLQRGPDAQAGGRLDGVFLADYR